MDDLINMSLDDIIKQNKQNRVSRSRGRGNGTVRGRGGAGGGRGRGRGGGGRGRGGGGRGRGGRGRSQSRPGTPGGGQRSRSQSQNRGRSQSRSQSQNRGRSRSRNRSRSRSRQNFGRARSASRGRRALTPKGRAGLEDTGTQNMPPLTRYRYNRGGGRGRLYRSNSNPNLQNSIHSRLGVTTHRGGANFGRPLAVAKRGISKRGRGFNTGNRYSNIGLRSDQILREQRNNLIKSQTFSRRRNNSMNASQLTVSVANEFSSRKRRNSVGSGGYLNQASLQELVNQLGGYNLRRGPGSVRSMGSNRSNYSNRSNRSNYSQRSNRSNVSGQSNRSRGRGRGGRMNRGVGRKFVNKQILNPQLQQEIAALQGRSQSSSETSPGVINFEPTPAATKLTLHKRFGTS